MMHADEGGQCVQGEDGTFAVEDQFSPGHRHLFVGAAAEGHWCYEHFEAQTMDVIDLMEVKWSSTDGSDRTRS